MRLASSPDLLELLHSLIGMHGEYDGAQYRLIEVIDSSAMLVIEPVIGESVIQNSFMGEARRVVLKNYSINIMSEVLPDLHPVAASFFGSHISAVLREQISRDLQ